MAGRGWRGLDVFHGKEIKEAGPLPRDLAHHCPSFHTQVPGGPRISCPYSPKCQQEAAQRASGATSRGWPACDSGALGENGCISCWQRGWEVGRAVSRPPGMGWVGLRGNQSPGTFSAHSPFLPLPPGALDGQCTPCICRQRLSRLGIQG